MRSAGSPTIFAPERRGLVVGRQPASPPKTVTHRRSRSRPQLAGEQLPGEADRLLLEVVAEGEVAEHLEEGVVARGAAHLLEVVVLAAGAHALLRRGGASVRDALSWPEEDSLNCTIPALVNSRVGSLDGTSELSRTTVWPRAGEVVEELFADCCCALGCHGQGW